MTQKHGINFGDLVYVAGYGGRLFFVDGWTHEKRYSPEETYDEVWFDVTCAHTGEYHLAELRDVKLACRAEQADEFLKYNRWEGGSMFPFYPNGDDDFIGNYLKKLIDEPKAPAKSKQARIDELLDEYNDIKRIIDEFGDDVENDYEAKINEIEREIKMVSLE